MEEYNHERIWKIILILTLFSIYLKTLIKQEPKKDCVLTKVQSIELIDIKLSSFAYRCLSTLKKPPPIQVFYIIQLLFSISKSPNSEKTVPTLPVKVFITKLNLFACYIMLICTRI